MYAKKIKRPFDFFLSLISIIVLAPLFLLIGISSVILEGRPVLFVSTRIGINKTRFKFFKFRSMPVGTDLISSDRIKNLELSPLGKFLRRTNIDELPQLWNILIGDMSFVGPRPPLPSQIDLIKLRHFHKVDKCRPGLTGLAQVNGFNGMSIAEKVKYDTEYVYNITFKNDLKIILQTFSYILKPPPVY